ncbi:uncharacterized protein LOC126868070 [Bombus huntii]|uniref:uncharacterized protein LOC126868070 n=1 Tax=Bombus huntii TaxID=85661 RepID=UPI0021A9C830|nr:uncharacterized protein LOC126868070 [Bombus huntii]
MTAVSNPPAQNVGASDSIAAAISALREQTIQIVSSTTGGISRHHSSAELREHHIETTLGPPVYKIPRRLAPDRLKQVKAEFELMIEQGVERPSKSPWASPLHVVPKRYGNLRPCGDYRALNARMIPDRWYTPPHIEDFAPHLHVFNRLNDYGVVINPSKCGYNVNAEGIKPPTERVEAIIRIPKPTDVKQLRRYDVVFVS